VLHSIRRSLVLLNCGPFFSEEKRETGRCWGPNIPFNATFLNDLTSFCEKYTHPFKLKEWTQRHVEYTGSETLMTILQGIYTICIVLSIVSHLEMVQCMQEDRHRFCANNAILYKGLEHPSISLPTGVLEPIPSKYQETTVYELFVLIFALPQSSAFKHF
jgi:hypothetical protein